MCLFKLISFKHLLLKNFRFFSEIKQFSAVSTQTIFLKTIFKQKERMCMLKQN